MTKIKDGNMTIQEYWSQSNTTDRDILRLQKLGISAKKISSKRDEILYSFSGATSAFKKAQDDGFFYARTFKDSLKTFIVKTKNRTDIVDAKNYEDAVTKISDGGDYSKKTKAGWDIIMTKSEASGRKFIVGKKGSNYFVGAGYNADDGEWGQGYYDFETKDEAIKFLKSNYRIIDSLLNDTKTTDREINYDDDTILVKKGSKTLYKGMFDYWDDKYNFYDDFTYDKAKQVYKHKSDASITVKVIDSKIVDANAADMTKLVLKNKTNDYDEYTVEVFVNGKRYKAADYMTDDYDDAVDTLTAMAKQAKLAVKKSGKSYIADSITDTYFSDLDIVQSKLDAIDKHMTLYNKKEYGGKTEDFVKQYIVKLCNQAIQTLNSISSSYK